MLEHGGQAQGRWLSRWSGRSECAALRGRPSQLDPTTLDLAPDTALAARLAPFRPRQHHSIVHNETRARLNNRD